MGGWAIAQSPILRTTITLERLRKRGYESMLDIYKKISPQLNEPLYTRPAWFMLSLRSIWWCESLSLLVITSGAGYSIGNRSFLISYFSLSYFNYLSVLICCFNYPIIYIIINIIKLKCLLNMLDTIKHCIIQFFCNLLLNYII